MEIALVTVLFLINFIAGVYGTRNCDIWHRINLFLSGALALQLFYLITGAL